MEKSFSELQAVTEELASCVEEYMRLSAREVEFEREYKQLQDIEDALHAAEEDFVKAADNMEDIEALKMKEPAEFMLRYADHELKMMDYNFRQAIYLCEKRAMYLRWASALKKLAQLLEDEKLRSEFLKVLY